MPPVCVGWSSVRVVAVVCVVVDALVTLDELLLEDDPVLVTMIVCGWPLLVP